MMRSKQQPHLMGGRVAVGMSYARYKVRTHVRERGYSIGVPLRGASVLPPPPGPAGDIVVISINLSELTDTTSVCGCLYIFIIALFFV